jgi:predicted RNA-binding Zn ribbon-like protein
MRPEPVAVAFANTRSSAGRDRIADLTRWHAWLKAWPGLASAGRSVDADGLARLRSVRDDVQTVLRAAALALPPDEAALGRVLDPARVPSPLELRRLHGPGGYELAVPGGEDPGEVVARHLARAAVDVLVTGPALAACRGEGCLKVFVATRADRRWCDSAVCGNRTRVRAHHQRHTRPTA